MSGPVAGAIGSIGGALIGSRSQKSGGVNVPRWYSDSAQGLAQFGRNAAMRPYNAPPENRVAPFSQDTLAAFDLVRNGVGTTQPYYQNAMNTAERLQGYNAPRINPALVSGAQFGQQIGAYQNPYTNQVVDATLADFGHSRDEQAQAMASAAQAAGAFGGSRYGVAEGQFNADTVRDQGLLAAQLRNQGLESAAGRTMQGMFANQDSINRAALANQSASLASADVQNRNAFLQGVLGDRLGAANAQDASALGAAGSAQQAQQQQGLDNQYADWFDRNRAYPQFQAGLWGSALGPGAATIAGQGTVSGGGLLGALGGAQLGANVGNSISNWYQGLQQPLAPIDIYAQRIPTGGG